VKETPGRIPPEDRADFRSYTKATWRDLDNREHQRYRVQAMKDGSGGYEIIDTFNNANAGRVVSLRFGTSSPGVDAYEPGSPTSVRWR